MYSAIRVDNNTMLAVKKFKVVSDITGIDQNKLMESLDLNSNVMDSTLISYSNNS